MRTYGRVQDGPFSQPRWVIVQTTPDGQDDYVWITTLIQCLKLETGESPFYANYGVGAQQSVVQQIFPDFDVSKTQEQFAARFASLIVAKQQAVEPTYRINILTNAGVRISEDIAV